MRRVVLDTNVLVSAIILPSSRTGRVLLHLRNRRFIPLYHPIVLEELVDVLHRQHIREKYGITASDVRTVTELILTVGENVEPVRRIAVCRDPKDDIFLEIAIAGQADAVVTGDKDLLVLHPFEEIPIIGISAFLDLLDDPR